RIVGGDFMPENEAPYAVSVALSRPGNGGGGFCGGTLISDRHVLTAAHCLTSPNDKFQSSYTVTVGYNSQHRDKQTRVKATKVDIHPIYYENTDDDKYDIAVLTIPPITFGAGAQRMSVDDGRLEANQPLLAVGWGGTEEHNGLPNRLKRVTIKVGDPGACGRFTSNFGDSNGPRVCALKTLTPGKGICMGDSGSGVSINRNGQQYLVGISSRMFGWEACDADDVASSFVHVVSYLDFVMEKSGLTREYLLGKKTSSPPPRPHSNDNADPPQPDEDADSPPPDNKDDYDKGGDKGDDKGDGPPKPEDKEVTHTVTKTVYLVIPMPT
ncbi:hypothetical protein IWQ57_005035, partial [Coemansia nantahalensis]